MEKFAIPNKLPSKQITVLTHRKKRINQKQQTLKKKPQKKINVNNGEHFKKPEFFVAEYRKAERDDKRIKRELMRHGLQRKHMKDGALVVVFRHRGNVPASRKIPTHTILVSGTHIASEQCINLLNQIGLRRMHQAVFLRFTPEVKAVLTLVEPYVIYGTPNIISVRDLIFKYGFIKHMGRKTSISSNTVIEEIFGQSSGIICVEDIVHEVFTVGANFDKVTKAMYPFLLPNPKDGWIGKKGLSFEKGGIAGYRGSELNEMLKNIL